MRVNPFVDVYGYLFGNFVWSFNEFWSISVSGYVQPFETHLIDFDFWKSVNYPEWWTAQPKNTLGDCLGLKTQTFPVLVDLSFDFGWPTCSWSLERFLTWVDPVS